MVRQNSDHPSNKLRLREIENWYATARKPYLQSESEERHCRKIRGANPKFKLSPLLRTARFVTLCADIASACISCSGEQTHFPLHGSRGTSAEIVVWGIVSLYGSIVVQFHFRGVKGECVTIRKLVNS